MTDKRTIKLFIETPKGDRFEADIPCSAKVSQVAADFFESQEWSIEDHRGRKQRAVVELVDPGNPDNTKRLNGDRGICESGLRNGDTLRITPESRGGGPAFNETETWLHESIRENYILRSARRFIRLIAWSPTEDKILASVTTDETICLWNIDTRQLSHKFSTGHLDAINSIAWSPDGKTLASASSDRRICLWKPETGKLLDTFMGHEGAINSVSWSSDSKILASGSSDRTIRLWEISTGQLLHTFTAHDDAINSIAWSPDGKILASGSSDRTIRLWNRETNQLLHTFAGHQSRITSVSWSPDGNVLASSAEDNTIQIWNIALRRLQHILQDFVDIVDYLSFSHDGRFLASKSLDGTIRLWRSDIWKGLEIVRETPLENNKLSVDRFPGFAFHHNALVIANPTEGNTAIYILHLNLDALLTFNIASSVKYANAKVVLLGDTSVGKTGLSLVLTGKRFVPTDSTHGRHVWVFDNKEVALHEGGTETQETLLWDLAGQPGYRLVHQLHLNEAVVALIVFDASKEVDIFAGVYYWNRALLQAQQVNDSPLPLKKFLVAARVDRGGRGATLNEIESLVNKLGFDGYFETSARRGKNIPELFRKIQEVIDWSVIPKETSTVLFQQIKGFLIIEKNSGRLLSLVSDLYHTFLQSENAPNGTDKLREQFEFCIKLIESQGLIRRLHRGNCVLLQPELLDMYASALVTAAKDEFDGSGNIAEEQVWEVDFSIPADLRVRDKQQERFLLESMVKDLLRQEIILREPIDDKIYLIFPSQSSLENQSLAAMTDKTAIFYFEGSILHIYAKLVVRLSQSGIFKKKEIGKNGFTYMTQTGGPYGIHLENTGEGKGSLTLYCENSSEEMRFYFENFVYDHLKRMVKADKIYKEKIYACKSCKVVMPSNMIQLGLEKKIKWLTCPFCETRVWLLDDEGHNKDFITSTISRMNHNADEKRDISTQAFIFQMLVKDLNMTQGDNIRITANDISNTGGQQVVGKAENVTANITPNQEELVKALQTLRQAVLGSTHLSDDEKQEQVAMITQVSEEAVKPKPNKAFLKALVNGLLGTLKMIPDVTEAVKDVTPLLNHIHL